MKLNRPSRAWHDHDLNGRLRHGRTESRRSAPEPSLSGTLQAYTPTATTDALLDEPVEAHIVDSAPSAPLTTIFETEPAERVVHETQSYEPNPFTDLPMTAAPSAEPAAEPWTPEIPPMAAAPLAPVAAAPAPTLQPIPEPLMTPAMPSIAEPQPVAATPAPAVPMTAVPTTTATTTTGPADDVFALLLDRLRESQAGVEVLLGASIEAVAAARDEVAQHRSYAEAEATAIIARAHAEAERIRSDALADVEDARRRLARFSAEIESLAGELHDRHLG